MSTPTKKKIAILGGGPSGLACAYYLTSREDLREKFDITIYSMGWKLGGKGSSGRGANGRIEEHGLHILFGAYHSFFRSMRSCYEELDRPSGHPMRTWREAFKPHDFGVVEDRFKDRWAPWSAIFPRNRAIPGDRGTAIGLFDYLTMGLQGIVELFFGWRALWWLQQKTPLFRYPGKPDVGPGPLGRLAIRLLKGSLHVGHLLAAWLARRRGPIARGLRRLRKASWALVRELSKLSLWSHRVWLGLDFADALLTGVLVDGVFEPGGMEKIDHLDYREWLELHGAHPLSLAGPYGRAIYDAAFSYADGEASKQRIAAGVGVSLQFGFGLYRGHMYYKMSTGMGDAVFAPFYLVLKRRGVKFRFFHKVDGLHLSDDLGRVDRVTGTAQARLAPGREEYEPLIDVKGLECWPDKPLYDQLENGSALEDTNLESYYQKSPLATPFTLRAGEDYDQLVFAIPIGAVPLVCPELVDASTRWQGMVEHVTSVQTLAFQIWTKRDLRALGWTSPPPLLSVYVEPLNTWSDMSQVLGSEDWPENLDPGSVSYFTGAQPGPRWVPHPDQDPDFEKRETARAKHDALTFMRQSLAGLMPNMVESAGEAPDKPGAVAWNELVDPRNGHGEERFDSQYWRSNCGPSERCTLAEPGSIRHRIEAGDTDFENLVITGDWIDNGIYAACMEGAFNAGILAARAVSGVPFPIDGIGYTVTRGRLHPDRAKDAAKG